MSDLRKGGRMQLSARVALSWADKSGNSCATIGECIDISETGMKLRVKTPLDPRAYISLRCEKAGLRGVASVRHCVHDKMTYIVGVEFSSGMKASLGAAAV